MVYRLCSCKSIKLSFGQAMPCTDAKISMVKMPKILGQRNGRLYGPDGAICLSTGEWSMFVMPCYVS